MKSATAENGVMIDFGPHWVDYVPYKAINELEQVRTDYDLLAIDELATAIQSGEQGTVINSDSFDLANPLLAGRHTKKSAKKYINDHGEYYRIASKDRVDYQNLTPYDQDTAVILIAGHRRRRAVGRLIDLYNIQPDAARIASNIRDEIEFGQAIGLQLRENVYERPSPQDEARAIDLSYRYTTQRLGHAPNIRKLSAQLGFKETKVRDAIAFASLPDAVQEFTRSGALSYSVVRRLKPLYDEYVIMYRDEGLEVPEVGAENAVVEFCQLQIKRRLEGKSEESMIATIKNQTRNIQDTAKYKQGMMDVWLEAPTSGRRREIAGRQLARTALGVMRYGLSTGDIKDEELARLEEMVAAYRARQASYETTELPLGLPEAS
jgi:hypothetical protein